MSQKAARCPEQKTVETKMVEQPHAQLEAIASSTNAPNSMAQNQDANLEKVRELLFGNQVRTHEQQFQDIERQLASVKADFSARFERLEDTVDKGFGSLTQQIQAEREARQQAMSRTHDASRAAEADLAQKITKLDKKLDGETQSLLQEILEQSSQLTTVMHEKAETVLAEIEKEIKQRRSQTQTERDHLSALFGELSTRLKDAG